MVADLNLDRAVTAAIAAMETTDDLWEDQAAHLQHAESLNPRYLEGVGKTVLPMIVGRMLDAALPHILEAVARPFDVDDPYATIFMTEVAAVIRGFGETRTGTTPDQSLTRQAIQRLRGTGGSENRGKS